MRVVLAKNKSSKKDRTWYCILLKIRLTNQEMSDIKQKHKRKIVQIKYNSYFKIRFDCKPIDQIEKVLKEIQEGRVNVNGVLSKPIGYDYDTILNKEIINDSGFSNDEESNGFGNKIVCTPMYDFPMTTMEKLGIKKDEIDITTSDLEYCLGMTSISNSNNIVIVLPVYCKRLPVPLEDQGKYLAIFQIHKALIRSLVAKVRISPDGRIADTKDTSLSNFKTIARDQHIEKMTTAALPLTAKLRKVAEPKDHIEIQISHKKLTSMKLIEQFWAHEILTRKESHDMLTEIMNRIDPGLEKLELWLEGESKITGDRPTEFENAITILLSLCGFRAIHVGDKYETITEPTRHKAHKKASTGTDMIISPPAESDMIFLCQCTTNWNSKKITDILDFSNEMRSVLSDDQVRIYPVIFTQIQANQISASISDAEHQGVRVVTITELRKLLNDIRDGYKPYELAASLMSQSVLSRYSDG